MFLIVLPLDILISEKRRRLCSELIYHKYQLFQMGCALAANLMMMCHGLTFPSSGFMIPQLEDPKTGFGISKDDGSWVGE